MVILILAAIRTLIPWFIRYFCMSEVENVGKMIKTDSPEDKVGNHKAMLRNKADSNHLFPYSLKFVSVTLDAWYESKH